jgi:hypothetical protein
MNTATFIARKIITPSSDLSHWSLSVKKYRSWKAKEEKEEEKLI